MAIERTFSMIKPDATRATSRAQINASLEGAGLRIVAQSRIHMSRAQAEGFYAEHSGRGFFGDLVRLHESPARSWCRCWKARTRSPRTAR